MSWAINHKGMVCSIAHKVHRRALSAGVTLDLDDLIQDGSEIAIQAERLYDPARGTAESTYLYRALMRYMNNRVDYAIYYKHHEADGIETIEGSEELGDDLKLWDFLRTLSEPAQLILTNWLTPSKALHEQIKARTIGRRCSLRALFLFLKEQGHDAKQLKALEEEIFTKAGLYES